jgi:hypothetical protein
MMEEVITYTRTEELNRAFAASFSKAKYRFFWLFLLIMGVLQILWGTLSITLSIIYGSKSISLGDIFVIIIGFGLICMPTLLRLQLRRIVRDSWQDDREVTIHLSDEGIKASSARENRSSAWTSLTHIINTGDFLLLFSGKALAFSIPVQNMSDEQVRFICEKVARK